MTVSSDFHKFYQIKTDVVMLHYLFTLGTFLENAPVQEAVRKVALHVNDRRQYERPCILNSQTFFIGEAICMVVMFFQCSALSRLLVIFFFLGPRSSKKSQKLFGIF